MSKKIKIDPALAARKEISVKAIAVYSKLLEKQLISSVERGEQPKIHIYLNWNEKRQVPEIAFVFAGEYRIEPLTYFKKNPKDWINFGRIVTSCEQAAEFLKALEGLLKYCRKRPEVAEAALESFRSMVLELSDLRKQKHQRSHGPHK